MSTAEQGLPGPGEPDPAAEGELAPECSSKGCRASATWQVRWNNPRLHTPERRKIWLACDEHRGSLADFLQARGFLKDVVAFDASAPRPE